MPSDIGPVCLLQLEFMKWADNMVFAALSQVPPERTTHDFGCSFRSMLGTLNHVYLAEWVWFERIQGRPSKITDKEPPADVAALGDAWTAMHRAWLDWAASFGADDWSRPFTFRNNAGAESTMPYWQIVLHLVNHGSYHRGQFVSMLRESGITPPGTDLITFYRTR